MIDYKKLTKKHNDIKPYLNKTHLYHYKFIEDFDIENTYHSNAIEGNTLTLQETALILDGCSVGNKNMRELYEVTNHSKAFNYIFDRRNNLKKIVDHEDILKIHSMILDNIDDYNKGTYRRCKVGIVGTNLIFPYPEELPKLMNDFNDWLTNIQSVGVMHPVELASKAHFRFVDIHPFIDGNGRTARLLMNMLLLKNEYPPLIIKVEDKKDYIDALNNTRSNNPRAFDEFIYKKMDQTLNKYDEQVKEIEKENIDKDHPLIR